MQFRRKSKILSGVPQAVYALVFVLITGIFFANLNYFKPEVTLPEQTENTVVIAEPTIIEDSIISKPEIYIPEVEMLPADTTANIAKVVVEEPKIEAIKSEKIEPKKLEAVKKPSSDKIDGFTKIGPDRPIISFIPGTNGKSGKLPAHNCNVKGDLVMIFTVNKDGNVIRAGRSSGIKNDCATTAAVIWIKQYVKTKKSHTESKGFYTIKF